MKPKEIRDLLDYIVKLELDEVNIETEQFKISIKKYSNQQAQYVDKTSAQKKKISTEPTEGADSETDMLESAEAKQSRVLPRELPGETGGTEETPAIPGPKDKFHTTKSPMIGTFYVSANPESPPFVNVGDVVKKGQTLCVIEAMKLFNEIESDIAGKIVEVLVEDANPVEYDQPLFVIDPS
ncbi:MAG: acetyl-CoA carboxylase biotin carboxyl carrier protein [Cytophagales bacterium]|nr:acetyl-CoA carboxylase biotin carboxyl carrier protein [Cytophagales bacterium]